MADYTIKKGDTLSKIAKANNVTVLELAKLNKDTVSDINKIYAGKTLRLSDPTKNLNTSQSLNNQPSINLNQSTTTLNQSTTDIRLYNRPIEPIGEVKYDDFKNVKYYRQPVRIFGDTSDWSNTSVRDRDKQMMDFSDLLENVRNNPNSYYLTDESGNEIKNGFNFSELGDYKNFYEYYNANRDAFDDYLTNFLGSAWDTRTEEGQKVWKGMSDFYNKDRKNFDKAFKTLGITPGTRQAYLMLYDRYSSKKKYGGLIPRKQFNTTSYFYKKGNIINRIK